ncbi:MAG: hypothetical protein CVU06_00560 [Bacteroidetes bacterium HGW-Bacteroidetes-22]|nr:MAG: hypothetical protein CVU06_00560 [Bacteroidetes bacterium HGW-Bacteroidetes-22]
MRLHHSKRKPLDYGKAINQLAEKCSIGKILADTGSKLENVLINSDLIDEISLLISPEILGNSSRNLFEGIDAKIAWECTHCEMLKDGYVWLIYKLKEEVYNIEHLQARSINCTS